ncbi:hypothetical protein PAPYR_12924 [Paratrimastix pyriformis]|uniref:Uncharacterized protein n=1 Tax=Paratrimastix pyriformis TaxID=342808 RepID=A0ABQ8U666_9EUKA|nr:hypothetical protein PAPYR_12924 [Paratrimastix pyriformis]
MYRLPTYANSRIIMHGQGPPRYFRTVIVVGITLSALTLFFFASFFLTTHPHALGNAAFVSVMAGDSHLPGALSLGYTFDHFRAQHPELRKVMLVTEDVSPSARRLLDLYGWELKPISKVDSPFPLSTLDHQRLRLTFTKLEVFNPRHYHDMDLDRVVFMDADTLILRPDDMSGLFTSTPFAAFGSKGFNFNSGVMVFRPEANFYGGLMQYLGTVDPHRVYILGDQDVLNGFMKNVTKHYLSSRYNYQVRGITDHAHVHPPTHRSNRSA